MCQKCRDMVAKALSEDYNGVGILIRRHEQATSNKIEKQQEDARETRDAEQLAVPVMVQKFQEENQRLQNRREAYD